MTGTPWLFAAAAAFAWVVWSTRKTAPAVLPPLVPSAALPPLAPVAAPAGGFASAVWQAMPWALVTVLAWNALHRPAPAPGPAPEPTPVSGLDLRGKFVGLHAAEDAGITAELLGQLATTIEWDGTQAEPRLRSGTQVSELRMRAREYRTSGVKLGDRQPMALDAIATFLDQAVGTDGGPLDAEGRRRWVDGFRAVSRAASAAIGR